MQTFLATFLAAEKFRTQQSTERCLGRIKTDINWENRLRQEAQLLSFLSLPLSFFPSFLWTQPSQTVSTFILPHTNFTYLSIYLSLSLTHSLVLSCCLKLKKTCDIYIFAVTFRHLHQENLIFRKSFFALLNDFLRTIISWISPRLCIADLNAE